MAAVKGTAGVIMVAATALGKITSYELSTSDTVIDSTAFDSTARTFEALGLPTYSLTAEVIFDAADAGQDALRTIILSGASASITLYPEGNTTGKMKLVASMVVESAKWAAGTMDGFATASITLKGGEMTETAAS